MSPTFYTFIINQQYKKGLLMSLLMCKEEAEMSCLKSMKQFVVITSKDDH